MIFFCVPEFESLDLLTPSQAAQLILTSGALNDSTKIEAVFDRLEEGDALQNVGQFLTALSAAAEVSHAFKTTKVFITLPMLMLNANVCPVSTDSRNFPSHQRPSHEPNLQSHQRQFPAV